MKFGRKLILLVLIVSLSFLFVSNVMAEETTLDESTLNENVSNINFVSGNAIIMGSLTEDLIVDSVLSNISAEFMEQYGISSVGILDGEDVLTNEDTVISDMTLLFTLNDESTSSYVLKVVGDLNDDSIVNNDDVELLVDSILAVEDSSSSEDEVEVTEDINQDSEVDVTDVTHLAHSINEGNWGIGQVELQDIVSSLNADDIVYVDDTIEVIYKVTGLNVGIFKGISGLLSYDKSLLELDSIFSDCVYGYLNEEDKFLFVFDDSVGDEVLITFTFKVNSRGDGSTTVSLDELRAAVDGVQAILDQESVSKGIQIDQYGKGGDEEETVEEEETTEEVVVATPVVNTVYNYDTSYAVSYVSLSGNNYIRSLEIKNQNINFDKDVLEYDITVGNNVDSLDLTIVLDDDTASYEVLGNENFKTGKNMVTIRVTAEDGSVREYIINVTKKEKPVTNKSNNISKYVVMGLIVLIIAGLVYVIFKDDEDNKK